MAYNEDAAGRVRQAISGYSHLDEIKMFGGICFTINGNMAIGVVKDDLVVRFDPDDTDKIMVEPHVRPMDFTTRPMRGFAFLAAPGYKSPAALRKWVERTAGYVATMPPKKAKKKR